MQSLALVALIPYFLGAFAAAAPPAGAVFTNPSQLPRHTYDYIVVGGGTAGSVVANRLSAQGSSVLVLEAGQDQSQNVNTQIPFLAVTLAPNTPLDWNYTTISQPGLNGRSISYARGFALGGSSVINYLVYNRGSQDDWDNYARIAGGDPTLSWTAALALARYSENWNLPITNRSLKNEYDPSVHSSSGPLGVSLPPLDISLDKPVFNSLNEPSEQAEFQYRVDMNGGNPLGVGWVQSTVKAGARSDSNTAYIQPALKNGNLNVLTGARVTRVLTTGTSNGLPIFRKVEFATGPSAARVNVTANKEVILAAGSFNTPQILMLSGIGDSTKLKPLKINTIVNNPSVGMNMSDHALLASEFRVNVNDTLQNFADPSVFPTELQQWEKSPRDGVLRDPGFRQMAWQRLPKTDPIFKTTRDPSAGPTSAHYEIIFGHGLLPGMPAAPGQEYIAIVTNVISPTSRGTLTLASSDPFAAPVINPNLLGTAFDKYVMNYALRAVKRYISSKAFTSYLVDPPSAAFGGASTDADLTNYAASYAGTVWHAVGTASISPKGAKWGVLNPDLTVKGTVGLSVVDASGIPVVPTAHTQGVIYIWAERAAVEIWARYA